MRLVVPAIVAELLKLKPIRLLLFILSRNIVTMLALGALKNNIISRHNPSTKNLKLYQQPRCRTTYSMTSETVPAPTVRPPSLIANLNPFSIAIGAINSIVNCELSPGITISTPSANSAIPVASVVRK